MITIVSGTNRLKSNSLKVSRTCEKLLKGYGEAVQVCCLTELPENFFSVMYDEDSTAPHKTESRERPCSTEYCVR